MLNARTGLFALALIVLALLAGSLVNQGLGGLGSDPEAKPPPDPSIAQVLQVIDGDTIRVRFVSEATRRVRYIGIDTPEIHGDVGCYGKAAANANGQLVAGEKVRLVFDHERRDRYGRLLAYVYRARDKRFVNLELVQRGFATPLTIPPNVEHAGELREAARQARARELGLWGACRQAIRGQRR